MPRLLVIDDRDQTVDMVQRQLPEFDTVTRCDRRIPCQVCEERERGCPLRCAHDYGEAARRSRGWTRCRTWSCWTCTSRCPRRSCCPRTSRRCPTDAEGAQDRARRAAAQAGPADPREAARELSEAAGGHADDHRVGPGRGAARRSAGLPVRERGGRQPQPGRGDLARARRPPHRAGRRHLLGTRARDGGAAPPARHARALAAAAADRGRDRHGQELPRRAGDPPALGRQGAAGRDRSVDGAARAAGGAPVRRAARRLHGRRRGPRGRVRAGARRHAVPRRDREPRSRAATAAAAGARARRRHAARRHAAAARRRPSWSRRPTRTSRRWCTRDGSAPTSTCASTRRRGCACRRCASAARICRTWSASRSSRRCARSRCGRWCVRTWRSSRRPEDFDENENVVVFGRPRAQAARRDAFSVFISREALARLVEHDWPGNHRELKLLAANALVFCLTRHLDVAPARTADAARAPAVLEVPDPLVTRLLGAVARQARPRAAGARDAPARAASRWRCSPRRASRASPPTSSGSTCARCSKRAAAISRAWRSELLGPRGSARQVHLRLNQLGLRLRDMRKTA